MYVYYVCVRVHEGVYVHIYRLYLELWPNYVYVTYMYSPSFSYIYMYMYSMDMCTKYV